MNFLFLETVGYESALRLSGHHYARLLVKRGHRVVSLSSPVSPFHCLSRSQDIERRFENHRRGFTEVPGGVLHYVPQACFPVRDIFPLDRVWALRLSARSYRSDVMSRLRNVYFKPDVVSLQNLMFYPLAHCFPKAILHYRMVDLIEGFTDMPASMIRLEKKILDEADLVSITSEQFAFKLQGANRAKMIVARNGVDVEHFSAPRPKPAAYSAVQSPIAVYVGALRAWFDWDLLHRAVEVLRDVHFFVISPDAPRLDMARLPNFTHLPGIPYEEIPPYYQNATVGIIPFQNSPLVSGVNPIKMFECLAAGTPVVASDWPELRTMNAPISLAQNADEFIGEIKRSVSTAKPSSESYKEFLSSHSWDANLDVLLARIGLNLSPPK